MTQRTPTPAAQRPPRRARGPGPAALRSGGGQPAGAPCATCAQKRPPPTPPCDFDRVEIKCKHCKAADAREIANVVFALDPASGRFSNNLVRSPNPRRTLVTGRFEVCGRDKVTLTVSGGPGFHPGHPIMMLTPPASIGPAKALRGPVHEVDVDYEPRWFETRLANLPRLGFSAGLRQFFFPPMAAWNLEIVACGARPPAQRHAFRRFAYTIAVYPKDTFKLGLTLPSIRKRERATSRYAEPGVDGTTRSSSETRGWARTSQSEREETRETSNSYLYRRTDATADRRGGVTQTQTEATLRGRDYSANQVKATDAVDGRTLATAKSFTFTHNGQDWSQSFKAAEFIEFIAGLRKQILDLIEFFKALANRFPKIGWTFSVEVEVGSGSLEYEWGYKEWKKDHTVYRYYKVEVAFTIVSARAELAFGLELLGAKAQVYGALTCELKLSGTREANPDATGPAATITAAPQVGGEVGVRGALGDWVEVHGKITAGFEGKAELALAPCSLKAGIELSEGKGTFTAKSRLFFSVTRSASLWEKRPIWDKTFFG